MAIRWPDGEADWIIMHPEMDFAELWPQFGTLLMKYGPIKPQLPGEGHPR